MKSGDAITVDIAEGNALDHRADVLILKFAQKPYGADAAAIERLSLSGRKVQAILPKPGRCELVETGELIAAPALLFVGVESLRRFGYKEMRDFTQRALSALVQLAPDAREIALTLHGVNYGLDEAEAFESEVAGIFDAVTAGAMPAGLQRITFVEMSTRRAARLRLLLSRLLPDGRITPQESIKSKNVVSFPDRLRSVGRASAGKPHVFVAMPFDEAMDDVFHYGIQGAVHAAGYLCERADLASFTGDILEWIKDRIATASLVIADLTTANPNVYLEVGFAWGREKPVLLVIRDLAELKFDVKGHRCIEYKKIKDLESALNRELAQLRRD